MTRWWLFSVLAGFCKKRESQSTPARVLTHLECHVRCQREPDQLLCRPAQAPNTKHRVRHCAVVCGKWLLPRVNLGVGSLPNSQHGAVCVACRSQSSAGSRQHRQTALHGTRARGGPSRQSCGCSSYLIHDINNGEAREQHLARASHIPPKGETNLYKGSTEG